MDLQWQAIHFAVAAACRASAVSGANGSHNNVVYPREEGLSCKDICSKTYTRLCDAEVSIIGLKKKATKSGENVGYFYNYGCDNPSRHPEFETKMKREDISSVTNHISYCCCRFGF